MHCTPDTASRDGGPGKGTCDPLKNGVFREGDNGVFAEGENGVFGGGESGVFGRGESGVFGEGLGA